MFNLIALAIVGMIAYIWMLRGYFSAMLHMCCVLVAGAIAFAAWEPLALMILEKGPDKGIGTVLRDSAWAIGLLLPFALSLAVIRPVVDRLLPLNAQTDKVVDYVGGGVCGAVAGLVTAGIVVLGLGMFRFSADFGGYQAVTVSSRGSIERTGKLILPVDRWVAGLYGHASVNALASNEPLAKWYPDLADMPSALRMSDGDGKDRNTVSPKHVNMYSRYTVGKDRTSGTLGDLLRDPWGGNSVQQVFDASGTPAAQDSYIEGYVIQFEAGAKEKFGQVVIGNAQVRLLVREADGTTRTLYPIAVATRANAADLMFGRFRFDAPVFVASPGAGSDTRMAFEFVIPKNAEPLALYVKNARVKLVPPVKVYTTAAERDQGILTGDIFGVEAPATPLVSRPPTTGRPAQEPVEYGLTLNNIIGKTIQKGQERGLELDGNTIMNGEATFRPTDFAQTGTIARELRVDKFQTTTDTAIVKVDVGAGSASSILGQAMAMAQEVVPPYLIDTNGTRYQAIGYIYEDRDILKIRYTPGNPLRGIREIPTPLSRSRTDQKLQLVFRVNVGVQINRFMLGDAMVSEFGPFPVASQRN